MPRSTSRRCTGRSDCSPNWGSSANRTSGPTARPVGNRRTTTTTTSCTWCAVRAGWSSTTKVPIDTVVIAIAAQPDAEVFAAQYDEVIDPPYTVAWDPAGIVAPGLSGLGTIDAIPAFIMLDAQGREVGRHYGYASRRILEQLWSRATGGASL